MPTRRGSISATGLTWRPLGRRAPTLLDVDLTVAPGERVLVVGPSGAGKSTLLLALAGALGTAITGEQVGSVDVRGRVGLLLQNPSDAVVAEHIGRDVAFGLENEAVPAEQIWPQVDRALARVGLPYGHDRPVAALSGGELQRMVLAGVLALAPDVFLLDEPTSMLDAATAATVRDAIIESIGGRTMIVVAHRLEPWLPHVDRVLVVDRGCLTADQSVSRFLARPAPPGVWMPGLPTPALVRPHAELVAPDRAETVVAHDVEVTLTARTLRGKEQTKALSGFSADVEPGRTTALVGPSGSGKSTALAVFGGLQRIDRGTVTPDRSRWRSRALAAALGWVPQNPEHGFVASRVRDEVTLTAHRIGSPIELDAVLDAFGLATLADQHPFRLSGGEQRRLGLAASLAHRPGLLLLDEPTVGQDPNTWAAVVGWMAAARDAGAGVAVATHDDAVSADRKLTLDQGVVG